MIEALDGGRPDATGHPERVRWHGSRTASPRSAWPSSTRRGLPLAAPGRHVRPRPGQAARVPLGVSRGASDDGHPRGGARPRWDSSRCFDQPTFDRETSLAAAGLAGVTTFSVDLAGVYDRLAAGFAATTPRPAPRSMRSRSRSAT